MCGIAGFWTPDGLDRDAEHVLSRMTGAIRHRGPDGEGRWCDPASGIALGHRRLAIIDLSREGHQPMVSADGRFVLIYNGEVYNFGELRRELEREGASFRGHSDTEVMLAAFVRWGPKAAVERFYGMFAFALWDRKERLLHLVRDRLGEKPLYYGWLGGTLLFGSELKALRAHPAWRAAIDREALTLFLRYGCVPAPHSIYEGIRKLMPATVLTMTAGGNTEETQYWSARRMVEEGLAHPVADEEEALEELDVLLRGTISREMVADVPLGAFLSGGIDSSTIVALMQAESTLRVRTFTIGFHERAYDEAAQARMVAGHLGTQHTELYVTPTETLAAIPKMPALYDEPFADSSQVPTFLVSQLARQHVTVSLSGDGADELFGGYNRYAWGPRIWRALSRVPVPVRGQLARGMSAVSPRRWDSLYGAAAAMLPARYRMRIAGEKAHKLASVLAVESPDAMYRELVSHWRHPASVVVGGREPASLPVDGPGPATASSHADRMMYLDLLTYLPNDILVKVDRASMSVSLEARAPYLDHRVVEFAWRLPLAMKVRGGQGKWLLRRLLARHVPPALTNRPKMGFGVPIDAWLRGPLRTWAEDLLEASRLRREGYLEPSAIAKTWTAHIEGSRNWQHLLWDVLMWQAWLDTQ
jgi:asparagine synthase (glutamine-hydrolysing)